MGTLLNYCCLNKLKAVIFVFDFVEGQRPELYLYQMVRSLNEWFRVFLLIYFLQITYLVICMCQQQAEIGVRSVSLQRAATAAGKKIQWWNRVTRWQQQTVNGYYIFYISANCMITESPFLFSDWEVYSWGRGEAALLVWHCGCQQVSCVARWWSKHKFYL